MTRRAELSGALALAAGLACVWFVLAATPAFAGKPLSGTMVVNGGAGYSTGSTVTVVAQVRGAKTMRYTNPDGSFMPWETYTPTRMLDLGADGVKVVTGQFRGTTGSRVTLQATITVDTTGPTTTSDHDREPRTVVTVNLTAVDELSGVATTWYRIDGGDWREGTSITLVSCRKRSGLRAGQHALESFSVDELGNVGPTSRDTIVLR